MTPRERDVLDFVRRFIAEEGCAPSYQLIAERIGLKSKSGVSRIVASLVAQRLLVRAKPGAIGAGGNLALPEAPTLQAIPSQLLWAELGRRGEVAAA